MQQQVPYVQHLNHVIRTGGKVEVRIYTQITSNK